MHVINTQGLRAEQRKVGLFSDMANRLYIICHREESPISDFYTGGCAQHEGIGRGRDGFVPPWSNNLLISTLTAPGPGGNTWYVLPAATLSGVRASPVHGTNGM